MNFTNITSGHDCDCLIGSEENLEDHFLRRIDVKVIKERDMRSQADRGKEDNESCDKRCGSKGISFDVYVKESLEAAINVIKQTRKFAPNFKKNIAIISLKKGAGKVKYTPNQQTYNKYHYDFFKSDEFNMDMIEIKDYVIIE